MFGAIASRVTRGIMGTRSRYVTNKRSSEFADLSGDTRDGSKREQKQSEKAESHDQVSQAGRHLVAAK